MQLRKAAPKHSTVKTVHEPQSVRQRARNDGEKFHQAVSRWRVESTFNGDRLSPSTWADRPEPISGNWIVEGDFIMKSSQKATHLWKDMSIVNL
jgi:hypothetical protein